MKGEYVDPPQALAPTFMTKEQAKAALDDLAWSLGQSAVLHLRTMYPAALKSVPKTASTSLRNHIRNQVNAELWPMIERFMEVLNHTKANP